MTKFLHTGAIHIHQVKRCDELARKLRFFKDQVHKSGVTITAPITEEDKLIQFDELEVSCIISSICLKISVPEASRHLS